MLAHCVPPQIVSNLRAGLSRSCSVSTAWRAPWIAMARPTVS